MGSGTDMYWAERIPILRDSRPLNRKDRFLKWRPINYSFVYVLIRLTSLVLKEHFFFILFMITRLVGLISTKTIGYFFRPPIMQSVYSLKHLTSVPSLQNNNHPVELGFYR